MRPPRPGDRVEKSGWTLIVEAVRSSHDRQHPGEWFVLCADAKPVRTWIVQVMSDGSLGTCSSSPNHQTMRDRFNGLGATTTRPRPMVATPEWAGRTDR